MEITWPPAYVIKKHQRARHVKLKASVHHGLEIIVPKRFNPKHIPDILETNKSWIEKQLAQIHAVIAQCDPQALPHEISLTAMNQRWKVQYIKSQGHGSKIQLFSRAQQQEVALVGNIEDKALCRKGLKHWVKKMAQAYLHSRLKTVSQTTQLDYQSLSVRSQRSRWGSCSTDKKINLNYKIIFLPENLADHILIHELCHTVHMDHSAKFWRLVAAFDPNWKQHSRDTRRGEKFVPAWVEI
jgi:predicted metal-dependent hydrolase